MTGLLVPEHRDERAPNPRDPASAQPRPEGSAARAIRLMGEQGEPQARDEAAGALKSPRIGAKSLLNSGLGRLKPIQYFLSSGALEDIAQLEGVSITYAVDDQ